MEVTTLTHTLINVGISLLYAIVTLVASIVTLYLIDHFLYRRINFIDEIRSGNIAASIFYSVVLLFVALLMTTSIN